MKQDFPQDVGEPRITPDVLLSNSHWGRGSYFRSHPDTKEEEIYIIIIIIIIIIIEA